MAEKRLIVVVEGTAAMGPFWLSIVHDFLGKITRGFYGNAVAGEKLPASNIEFSVVAFRTHGSQCGCLVQRSGWTRDVDIFLQWLSALSFDGVDFGETAIAEGLSEALMMFSTTQNGDQNQQRAYWQRHCILVAVSNPPVQNLNLETGNVQSDVEAVAKSFAQCAISLSVISPKQLPKLRAIYNVAKLNSGGEDPTVYDVKNPQFLLLISENFAEAWSALTHPEIGNFPSKQTTIRVDIASVSGPPPTSIQTVNGSIMNRQPSPVVAVPTANVKVELNTVDYMVNGLPPAGQTLMAVQMSNTISSGVGSSVPAASNVFSSGQSIITSMAGNLTQVAQNSGLGSFNSASSNLGIWQPRSNISSGTSMDQSVPWLSLGNLSGAQMVENGIGNGIIIPSLGMPQSLQSGLVQPHKSSGHKYVKVWEGYLFGVRRGRPKFITRLEGYRKAAETKAREVSLAANWPSPMQIVRLISEDHMHDKNSGKGDFLVFRALTQHGLLGQLHKKKLCAVIQLPSQTLLLSVSEKAHRLIGKLLPGELSQLLPPPQMVPNQSTQTSVQGPGQ